MLSPLWVSPAMTELGDDMHTMAMIQSYQESLWEVPQESGGKSLGIQSPCQWMIGVSNHLLSTVFRFHYLSQKVIGSLGNVDHAQYWQFYFWGSTNFGHQPCSRVI